MLFGITPSQILANKDIMQQLPLFDECTLAWAYLVRQDLF